jgi:hypothetical protein
MFAATIVLLFLRIGAAFALGDRPPPEPYWNYQGVWWASPAGSESGWAVGISHQGKTIRATWFTYDADGSPMWLVMPEGARRTYSWYDDTYTGPLYRTTSDGSRVNMTPVGTASFTFNGGARATFAYAVNGSTRSITIERQVFAARVPRCEVGGAQGSEPNYTDVWGDDSGWGIQVDHQVNVISATWFTFKADGKGEWLVMPNGVRDGNVYTGALYRTRGPAFNRFPWNPAQVSATAAGQASLTFVRDVDYYEGSYSYFEYAKFDFTLDGVPGSKLVSREEFAWPTSVCRGD